MRISRDRSLDDTARYNFSLSLQTHTPEMHSLLSDAPEEVRERLGEVLVQALDQIDGMLKPQLSQRALRQHAEFGCGT
jgi:hypothetical protein